MTNDGRTELTVWLVAHGSDGEYESAALDRNIALLGFQDVPDLTGKTQGEIDELIPQLDDYASNSPKSQGMVAGMMKAFALQMQVGDVVASPLKTQQGQIALGKVDGEYLFQEIDGAKRHTRHVKWEDGTTARADFGPEAFHYLVTKRTISRVRNSDVAERLRETLQGKPPRERSSVEDEPSDEVSSISVEESVRDQIVKRIHANFPGRRLEHLVAAILEAQGFVVLESNPGKDQGVDVLAGHGPLGFDHPRICVQVKHTETRTGGPEVQQLYGAMSNFHADRGLFVSWSDYTGEAKQLARQNFFSMRLWNANDLLEAIFENYDRLPDDIRNEVPLKQIWSLVPEDEE